LPDGYPEGGGGDGAETAVRGLERRVAAQAAALQRAPLNLPVPADVLALLAVAPHELDGWELPPHYVPRVAAVGALVRAMIDDITVRERELSGRIAAVRGARRSGPAAVLVDCES
jgi:hypothetical protein